MATIKQVLSAQSAVEKAEQTLWSKRDIRTKLVNECPQLNIPKYSYEPTAESFATVDGQCCRIKVWHDRSIKKEVLSFE